MEFTKKYKAYVLMDPENRIPRYVGITTKPIKQRFAGHLSDIYNRPELNKHKTAWFKSLLKGGKMPIIEQIAEFDNIEEMKQFEIDYIAKYKEKYKLINQTKGGDIPGFNSWSREAILKKERTRAVEQYNILGEKISEYEIMEDIGRTLNLKDKACSHITQCCKGKRRHAYGYIWRYKGEPLGDISDMNPKSLYFNKLVQYDLEGNRIAEYSSYKEASEAIGDKSKGGNIASVISGKQNSVKGFIFQVEPIYVYFNQKLFEDKYLNWKQDPTLISNRGGNHSIEQLDLEGNVLNKFNSMLQGAIAVYGYESARQHISKCIKDSNLNFKGYKWRKAS